MFLVESLTIDMKIKCTKVDHQFWNLNYISLCQLHFFVVFAPSPTICFWITFLFFFGDFFFFFTTKLSIFNSGSLDFKFPQKFPQIQRKFDDFCNKSKNKFAFLNWFLGKGGCQHIFNLIIQFLNSVFFVTIIEKASVLTSLIFNCEFDEGTKNWID